jgi:hypothetical protein
MTRLLISEACCQRKLSKSFIVGASHDRRISLNGATYAARALNLQNSRAIPQRNFYADRNSKGFDL